MWYPPTPVFLISAWGWSWALSACRRWAVSLCVGGHDLSPAAGSLPCWKVTCRSWGVKESTSEGKQSTMGRGGARRRWQKKLIETDKYFGYVCAVLPSTLSELQLFKFWCIELKIMMTSSRVHSRAVGYTSTTQKLDGLAVLRSRHIAYLSSFVLIMVSAAQLNDLSCLSYRTRKWAVLTSRASSFKFSLFMVTVYRGHTALHKIPASCEAWNFAL